MKKEEQRRIVEVMQIALEDIDIEENATLQSYSGRGMYGKRCVGITLDNISAFARFCAESMLKADDVTTRENLVYILGNTNQDSMGRSTIYYWPALEWNEEYE